MSFDINNLTVKTACALGVPRSVLPSTRQPGKECVYVSLHSLKSIRKSASARYFVTALLVAVLIALPVASPATSASSSGVNPGAAYQCSYSLFPDAQLVSKNAGSFSVTVTAGVGCGWTASSNDSWITITSGSSGSGNGTVNYDVSANTAAFVSDQ